VLFHTEETTRRLAGCASSPAGSSEASRVNTESRSRSPRPPVCTTAPRPARSPSVCRREAGAPPSEASLQPGQRFGARLLR
jgi:hypothetical protein